MNFVNSAFCDTWICINSKVKTLEVSVFVSPLHSSGFENTVRTWLCVMSVAKPYCFLFVTLAMRVEEAEPMYYVKRGNIFSVGLN